MSPKSIAKARDYPLAASLNLQAQAVPPSSFAQVLDRCPLGVIQLNLQQEVVYANEAASRLWGQRPEGGCTVRDLLATDEDFSKFQEHFRQRMAGKVEEYELQFKRQNRPPIPVSIAAVPLTDKTNQIVGAIGIVRSLLLEKVVASIDQCLKSSCTAAEIFRGVSAKIAEYVPYDLCLISIYDDGLTKARVLFAYKDSRELRWPVKFLELTPEGAEWLKRQVREPIHDLERFKKDPRWKSAQDTAVEEIIAGLQSAFRVPVVRKNQVVGSLSLFRRQANAFGAEAEEMELLDCIPVDKALLVAFSYLQAAELGFRAKLMKALGAKKEVDLLDKSVSELILHHLAEQYDWELFSIFLVNEEKNQFELQAQVTKPGAELPAGYVQPLTHGVMSCAYHGEKVCVVDFARDDRFRKLYVPFSKTPVKSELCLPIRVDDEVVAVLNVEDSRRNAFSIEEADSVEQLLNEVTGLVTRCKIENSAKAAFEWAPSAIFVVRQNGTIAKANPTATELLGYEEHELNRRPLSEVLEPKEYVLSLLRINSPFRDDLSLVRKDGRRVKVSAASSLLGHGIGTMVTAREIASRQRMEELDFLEQMFYDIAARTKIPFALALAWLRRLKEHFESPTAVQPIETAQELDKAIRQLRKVEITYEHLILYNKEVSGGIHPNPVVLQMRQLFKTLSEELPETDVRRLAVSGDGLDSYIVADSYQVSFALLAILSYALRFMPEEGDVAVKVTLTTRDDRQHVSVSVQALTPSRPHLSRRRSDAFLNQTITDIHLGSRIITSFVEANGGDYVALVSLDGDVEFRITLPVTDFGT